MLRFFLGLMKLVMKRKVADRIETTDGAGLTARLGYHPDWLPASAGGSYRSGFTEEVAEKLARREVAIARVSF